MRAVAGYVPLRMGNFSVLPLAPLSENPGAFVRLQHQASLLPGVVVGGFSP